jgi:hypothetical protein
LLLLPCVQSFSEMTVVGDRAHILLVLANISLADTAGNGSSSSTGVAATPIRLNSLMSWLGSSPAAEPGELWPELQKGAAAAAAAAGGGALDSIAFGYLRDAIIVPESSPKDALQLQQLVLQQLPQGPGVGAAVAAGNARIPAELWTVLLWSIKR